MYYIVREWIHLVVILISYRYDIISTFLRDCFDFWILLSYGNGNDLDTVGDLVCYFILQDLTFM